MQEGADLEANNNNSNTVGIKNDAENATSINNAHSFEPIRTDPTQTDIRKRRLDRHTESKVPEIHIVGQIIGGTNLLLDSADGAFCRSPITYCLCGEKIN